MKRRIKEIEGVIGKEWERREVIKNGKVREKQGYRCVEWGLNFIKGDERRKPSTTFTRLNYHVFEKFCSSCPCNKGRKV